MAKKHMKSIRNLIEKKGLENETIITKHNNVNYGMEMESLLGTIDTLPTDVQEIVFEGMVAADIGNDIMGFMKHLAKNLAIDQFNIRTN